jgi:hypothetical protein
VRHQPARQQRIQRQQLERRVTQDVDRRTPLAERHHRPEYRVFDETDKKL